MVKIEGLGENMVLKLCMNDQHPISHKQRHRASLFLEIIIFMHSLRHSTG